MSDTPPKIQIGRFRLSDVETIQQAKLLEENPKYNWDASDANLATRQAALSVGTQASASDLLLARAAVVEKMFSKKNPSAAPRNVHLRTPKKLLWGFFIISVFSGLICDQSFSQGHQINLLSFPFFGLLIWNILIYLASLIRVFQRKRLDTFGFKRLFEVIARRLNPTRAPLSILAQLTGPLATFSTARAFHLAALGFCLGLVASITLRGLGTAYIIGWESTWLAENPALVHGIITATYGLADPILGTATPNILDIANMRFDRIAIHGSTSDSAVWLLRIMLMLFIVVILPRTLLVLGYSFKLSRLENNYPLNLNDKYFANILRFWRAEAMTLDLLIPENNDQQSTVESAYRLAQILGFNLSEVKTHRWIVNETGMPLTLEPAAHAQQIWVLLNATTTPEEEVHGQSLEVIHAYMKNIPIILLVDLADYLIRFGDYNDRVQARQDLWKSFAKSHQLPIVFYHSGVHPDENTCEELRMLSQQ